MTSPKSVAEEARAFATRMSSGCLAAMELMTTYLGAELGLYECLKRRGPTSPGQLAEDAGIGERYAVEWLEQQAAAGIVEVHDASREASERRYLLPPGHIEALTNPESPLYVVPMAVLPVGGVGSVIQRLVAAYRSGTSLPYSEYGESFRRGQAGLNRSLFGPDFFSWIERFAPTLHRQLEGGNPLMADIGCGSGHASLAFARRFERLTVHGFDLDEESIAQARSAAEAAGLSDRVSFAVEDAARLRGRGRYAGVLIVDALHDMREPLEVLRRCRQMLATDGRLILVEPKAEARFCAPASETERFLYAVSLLHCLPVGLTSDGREGTGTLLRPEALDRLGRAAGFREVKACEIDHRFLRMYVLLPDDP